MTDHAWHDWRAQGIGGSDVPKILGLSSFGSAWSVWAEKIGLYTPDREYSERQQIGLDMEPALAASFTRRTGLHIAGQQTCCHDTQHPWRRCTVDGFVLEGPHGCEPIATWQAKTDGRYGRWETWENVPKAMLAQVTWEMGVTGKRSAWLTVGHAGWDLEHIEIPWMQGEWDYIATTVDRFWLDNVLTGTPPEIDDSDATTHVIAAVWADVTPDKAVDLTDHIELITTRSDLKDQEREVKDALKLIDNTLKAALQDAEIGTVGGLPMFTYGRQDGRRHTCTKCGNVDQGDPFRVLRTKKQTTTRKAAA